MVFEDAISLFRDRGLRRRVGAGGRVDELEPGNAAIWLFLDPHHSPTSRKGGLTPPTPATARCVGHRHRRPPPFADFRWPAACNVDRFMKKIIVTRAIT